MSRDRWLIVTAGVVMILIRRILTASQLSFGLLWDSCELLSPIMKKGGPLA